MNHGEVKTAVSKLSSILKKKLNRFWNFQLTKSFIWEKYEELKISQVAPNFGYFQEKALKLICS